MKDKENHDQETGIPHWQRAICAALALAGTPALLAMVWSLLLRRGEVPSLSALVLLTLASAGYFLFAFAAIKGRLPRAMQRPRPSRRQT